MIDSTIPSVALDVPGSMRRVALDLLLVDPQPFFCQSLGDALASQPNLRVVGWTGDEVEAERLASTLSPDVVLSELDLRRGSGLGVIRRLADRCPVVVLTRAHEGDVLLDAVAAGAAGCLSHDLPVKELAAQIASAARGRFVIHQGRLHETLKRASALRGEQIPTAPGLPQLTAREQEVLGLVARGLDNRAIAHRLYLSPQTVRTHVGNILRKLGVHTRADAARVALSEGQGAPGMAALHIRGPSWGEG